MPIHLTLGSQGIHPPHFVTLLRFPRPACRQAAEGGAKQVARSTMATLEGIFGSQLDLDMFVNPDALDDPFLVSRQLFLIIAFAFLCDSSCADQRRPLWCPAA